MPKQARANIVFSVVAAVLPAVLLGPALVGFDHYQRERARIERDCIATARALIAAVDAELGGMKSALLALASSPSLAGADLASFHAQALKVLPDHRFANILVIDDKHRQRVNTLLPFGAELPVITNPQLISVFETGRPVTTDLFVGAVIGRPLIGISVPVKIDGAVRYSVNASVLAEHLAPTLERQRLPPSWVAAIVDSSGTIVARTRDPARFVGQKASPGLLAKLKEKSEDTFEVLTVDNEKVLSSYSRSPHTGWVVAIGIPETELRARLLESLGRMVIVGFLTLALGVGMALFFASRVRAD